MLCWQSVHMRCTGALLHQQGLVATQLRNSLPLAGWGRPLLPPNVGCRHSVSMPKLSCCTPGVLISHMAHDELAQASSRRFVLLRIGRYAHAP